MESFGKATSKDNCFSLYQEKGKLFMQLFWPLSCTMVTQKTTFHRISVTMKKTW